MVTPSQNARSILEGKVESVVCPIFIDSGTDISMIHSSLVTLEQMSDQQIVVGYAGGPAGTLNLAFVWGHVNQLSMPMNVMICKISLY